MKIQYIANDGTPFDYEDECREYENQIVYDTEFKGCLFYNNHKEKIPFSENTIEDVWFMHLKTLEQLEKFKELSDNADITTIGLDEINKKMPLDFYYDEVQYPQQFKQYDNETDKLITRINKLQKEKDELFYNDL